MFENKKDNQLVKLPFGLRDILPSETKERNNLKEIIGREFKLWGYGEINTPVMEYTRNISIGVGKNWKDKLINFFDVDGNPVSLRSDMTIPIARLTGMRIKKNQLPVRFCYFADSFRQAGAQKGVRRVYNQAGLELIGTSNTIMADIEILVILINILKRLNLSNYKVGLGHVEFIEGLCDWFELDIKDRDYIGKKIIAKDFVTLENFLGKKNENKADIFIKLMQPESSIKKIAGLISGIEDKKIIKSYNYLKEIYDILGKFGYSDCLVADFSIIRDFDYYTGLLFEVYCSNVTGTIGSGGRYDGLIKKFGMDVPATGFALDVDLTHESIGELSGEESLKILLRSEYITNSEEFAKLIEIAQRLHGNGIIVELYFESEPNPEDLARDKKCDLLVEVESDFESIKINDLDKNKIKIKKIRDFIKEIGNERRN